ncbi:MAG: hypothetical protein IKF18_08230 [Erysipelotrichaceae bacterium]|nr:hypothetical protein [Erysipelotrichaceae bacterium]
MGNTILYILLIVAIYTTILNYRMVKRNKNSSGYVKCANALFKGDADAGAQIAQYLEKETVQEYREKTAIFKLYQLLRDEHEYTETLQNFNPSVLVETKGAFNPQSVITNSDSFIWACILLNKAGAAGDIEFVRQFMDKFTSRKEELSKFVEYKVMEATAQLYLGENEDWKVFCRNLLAGEYEGYRYERKLIGFYKRIAQLLLAEGGDELDEMAKDDLTSFAESSVGKMMMNDRGVYTKYAAPKNEEETEEEPAEEEVPVKETEEPAEETVPAEEPAAEETETVPAEETVEEVPVEEEVAEEETPEVQEEETEVPAEEKKEEE